MDIEHDARHTFARQLNALLDQPGMNAKTVRQIARKHGIGYSTLQSWRTGAHLPRVPDDNPSFRAFIEAVTADRNNAEVIVLTAAAAWRHYVARKRARSDQADVLVEHLLNSRQKLAVIWGPPGSGKSALAGRLVSEVSWLTAREPVSVELGEWTSPEEVKALVVGAVLPGVSCGVEVTRRTYQHLLKSRRLLLRLNNATHVEQVPPLIDDATAIVTSRQRLPELEKRGALCVKLGPGLAGQRERPVDPAPPYRKLSNTERIVFRRIARLLSETGLLRHDQNGRYSMSDTLRHFGAQRAADEDTSPQRRAAVHRLAAYYARRTTAAATSVYADMPRFITALPGHLPTPFASDTSAASWLITERANILATASAAFGVHTDLACSLADALRAFHQVLPQGLDWTSIAQAGLRAAQEDGCPLRTAAMHLAVGVASFGAGWLDPAISHLRQAVNRYRVLRKPYERAHVLLVLSAIEHATGNLTAARAHCLESLRLRRKKGQAHGQASSLVFLADIGADFHSSTNRTDREVVSALTLSRRVGYTAGVAGALGVLGRLAIQEGRLDAAASHFGEQLTMTVEHGFGSRQAIALVGLARVRQLTGHHEEANELADDAAVTAREWANPAAYIDALNVAGSAHLSRGRFAEASPATVARSWRPDEPATCVVTRRHSPASRTRAALRRRPVDEIGPRLYCHARLTQENESEAQTQRTRGGRAHGRPAGCVEQPRCRCRW